MAYTKHTWADITVDKLNTRPQPADPMAITRTVDSGSGTLTGSPSFYNPDTSSDYEEAPSSLTVYIQGFLPVEE